MLLKIWELEIWGWEFVEIKKILMIIKTKLWKDSLNIFKLFQNLFTIYANEQLRIIGLEKICYLLNNKATKESVA